MKKHIFKLLAVVGVAILSCMGCSLIGSSKLKLEDGVLSWDAQKEVAYYEVAMGDVSTTCQKEEINLSDFCKLEGEYTITVSSVSTSEKTKKIGSLDIVVEALAQPSVSIMETDSGETYLTWTVDERAKVCGYDLHDGYGARKVDIGENHECQVVLPNNNGTMLTVVVEGTSKDNTLYVGSQTSYRYQGKMLFNLADMVKYPFYTVSAGSGLDDFTFGTTLTKGVYDLEVSFYVTDINGSSLSGEGRWGRRLWNVQPAGTEQLIWFCENAAERFPESANTLPTADQMVTRTLEQVQIDKYGETTMTLADFNANEMLVIADIKYGGKSVMAEGLKVRDDEPVFDTAKLSEFLAVFKSAGSWYVNAPEQSEFEIPVNMKDGIYTLEISYQLMKADGRALVGNGLWGRRITNATQDDSQLVWYCDYPFPPHSPGDQIPSPLKTVTSTFSGKVIDGKFKLLCLDFNAGEIMAVSSVKKISGSSERFNVGNLKNYKYVHKDSAAYDPNMGEKFVVETTKCERGLFEVELSYYVMDKEGYMLVGNGMWGRRMMCDSEEEIWVCNTAPAEAHKDAINTVAEPTTLVTKKVQVALNKKGRFTLYMHDFNEGEIVVIQDVKLDGESILK